MDQADPVTGGANTPNKVVFKRENVSARMNAQWFMLDITH